MKHILFLYICFGLTTLTKSVHFLGGTITWRPLNASATGSPVAIVITQTYSWTYTNMACSNSLIASNGYIPNYALVSSSALACINNCGAGSAGYSSLGVLPRCTDFSNVADTSIGQRVDIVNLAVNAGFSVAYQSNAWRSLATASSAVWSISTAINTMVRPDNGLYNNAPVATVMSPINIPVNQPTVINVPVADADGDTLRCRWSNNTNGVDECGGVCPPSSLPSGTVIYPNCTIIITGTHVGDWFAITLMVEDFINSTSTTPLSSVPVQFLVQVVAQPTCTTPPDIVGIPTEQSCTNVIVNQTYTSQILAINSCAPSVTIVDIATLSFAGMAKSNLGQLNSTVYYKNLTWTPTSAQLGYQVMCAMAIDSANSQSTQYCFKFYVSTTYECLCPGTSCITTTTTTLVYLKIICLSYVYSNEFLLEHQQLQLVQRLHQQQVPRQPLQQHQQLQLQAPRKIFCSYVDRGYCLTYFPRSTTTTTTTTSTTTTTTTSTTTTTATTTTTTTATTTTTTTTTTATRTIHQSDSTNWPLIKTILSILVFVPVALWCCWCCRYCWLLGSRSYGLKNEENEFYHIERCTDPECLWSNETISTSDIFSIPYKNYFTSRAWDEDTICSSNTDQNNLSGMPSTKCPRRYLLGRLSLRSNAFQMKSF
ncbi:unnamed protein product [Adineta steineri]|uniref:Uncharacterized protein n=1 Tax=Adineta steineri TaxID=433720 RepID=A0A814K114_9BILA|nr:unnamed protein product [Adineta steineri]CAF3968062.1 unnamed protein product [Adineta steineri]